MATGENATADGALDDAVDAVPKYVQNFRPGCAAGLVGIVVAGLVDKSARCMATLSADTAPTRKNSIRFSSSARRCWQPSCSQRSARS
jgi:hypothetical protein